MAEKLADDLLRIHRIITRGISVARERGSVFARTDFPDARTREGYVSYARALLATLGAHHGAEEHLAFPRFRERIPHAPYDQLDREHRDLLPALAAADDAVESALAGLPASVWLGRLLGALDRVDQLWHAHIAVEEEHFSGETIDAAFSGAEQGELAQALGGYAQENSGPDYLVVPFMLHNLEPADRAAFSAKMPPVVTQQLVPFAWKEKWAPMEAFLLS
ncbi:MAG TPA: hemerythrin domain-containing protein [Thermoanaerobaculia bacterium]|jgi:hypothetical protein|nr:hemerythrin domain-containing protein [Thermoanaerobaculia bacterium]